MMRVRARHPIMTVGEPYVCTNCQSVGSFAGREISCSFRTVQALGLLCDGLVDLAKGMVDNFVYEIEHYGKILNANRSYYLTRTQPPFLTDMALQVFRSLPTTDGDANLAWLARAMQAAIKEYESVWMSWPGRFVPSTGLSRYFDPGIGPPTGFNAQRRPSVLTAPNIVGCMQQKHLSAGEHTLRDAPRNGGVALQGHPAAVRARLSHGRRRV